MGYELHACEGVPEIRGERVASEWDEVIARFLGSGDEFAYVELSGGPLEETRAAGNLRNAGVRAGVKVSKRGGRVYLARPSD